MLEVRDLHVRYGPIRALRGVDLDVSAGEAVGLIGPNGAGKTTLLSAVVGAVRPSQGSVTFEGASVLGRAPEAIVRTGIALVPEGRQIFGTLSVAENLMLAAKSSRDGAKPETEEVLELFPVLRTYYRSSAGKLSGGEQQQLAIARVLLTEPKLLIMDEPTEGIQPSVIQQIEDAIQRIKGKGIAVLLVEQYVEFAWRLADAYAIMRKGAIVSRGATADLHEELVREHLTI